MAKISQTSFGSGVMSGTMLGRVDDDSFRRGLAVCENFIVLPQGPISNRSGTEFVAEVRDSSKRTRLIPFIFANDQAFVLEFGHLYVRIYSRGSLVQLDNGGTEIETPYREEDLFALDYAQKNDFLTIVHPAYPPQELKRYSNTDWRLESVVFYPTLQPPATVSAIKKTAADQETNAGKYTFLYRVTSLNADRSIESVQSAATSCVANIYNTGTTIEVSWSAVQGAAYYRVYRNEGGVYCYIGETDQLSIIDDNLSPEGDITPPRHDDVFITANGISSFDVTAGGEGYEDYIAGIDGEVSSGLLLSYQGKGGQEAYVLSNRYGYPANPVVDVVDVAGSGAVVRSITKRYTEWEDSGGDGHYEYFTEVIGFQIQDPGHGYTKDVYLRFRQSYSKKEDKYGYIYRGLQLVTARPEIKISDETGYGAVAEAITQDGVITGIEVIASGRDYSAPTVEIIGTGTGASATATVSTGTLEFPSTVTYHEQRRVFGGTTNHPQRIVMSQSGNIYGMAYHIPVQDDDRVKFDIDSGVRNSIRHLISLNRLIALAESGEFVIMAMNDDAITPRSAASKAHSYIGSTTVKPVVVGTSAVYCAARGGYVREISYNYQAGGYVPIDLSVRAADLFEYKTIKDMTFQSAPYPIVWCISSDGSLLGLTYMPEQAVRAWHRHTTDGYYESCVCVPDGDYDVLYVVVRREIDGAKRRYIERFVSRKFDAPTEAHFVDCGLIQRGEPTQTVSGLNWLKGETVSILADGAEHPQRTVSSSGEITLEVPASVIHVGLPIRAVAETLPVLVPSQNDASGSVSRPKKVNSVWVRLLESHADKVGPNDEHLVEVKARKEETPGTPPSLVTGGVEVVIKSSWQTDASVRISQEAPMPMTVLGLCLDVTVGG